LAIFLSFLPWIAFLSLPGAVGARWSAAIAALLAVAMILRDRKRGRLKLLDLKGAACFVLFFATSFFIADEPLTRWSGVAGSAAIFLIVLATLLTGKPFTTPYAKEMTPPEVWDTPLFKHANVVISSGWLVGFGFALALASMHAFGVLTDTMLLIAAQVAAVIGPVLFQTWYRRRIERAPA
jgi:Ca2+/Na+ antiporter